jgi:hypothetical protein
MVRQFGTCLIRYISVMFDSSMSCEVENSFFGHITNIYIGIEGGEIVAQAATLEDELVTFAADIDICNMPKETIFNFARHRRVEHYTNITDQTGAELPDHLKL